jgi:hypothetical protein
VTISFSRETLLHGVSSFLGSTAQLRPWAPPQNPAEFLGGFSTIFLQGRVVAPRPTPIPEDQASVFLSPRGRVATHFSRLLRHAWVTMGLFLFPGHHTGTTSCACFILSLCAICHTHCIILDLITFFLQPE